MKGEPVVEVRITEDPIDPARVDALATGSDGAVVSFTGMVRGETDGVRVEALDYEAHSEMAERQMREIADRACRRWPLSRVLMVHRTGALAVGEASVLIAVASPHRAEAFEACRFLIDTLKTTAAIWKKESFADGSSKWVEHP